MAQSSEDRDYLDQQNIILSKLHAHLHKHKRFPHEDQSAPLRAIFAEGKKIVMGQCGRSFGKTEAILYIAWRFALMNPGSEIYIICPEIKQAKKIYWLPRRLQGYGPQEFVSEHRDSELRTVFFNGSYIILDGCENYDSLRGIKPDLVIYDEFQHHNAMFDEEVMQPNLGSGKVALVVMGTPPRADCYYVKFRDALLYNLKEGDDELFYIELPTACNPTQKKDWLSKKKAELIRKDKYNVWLREYEGKLVFDTDNAIIKFFRPEKHVFSDPYLKKLLQPDRHKMQWWELYDPGTATVFGTLFIGLNPYTSQVFIMDEIYATDQAEMTASAIWEKAQKKKEELCDRESRWTGIYDEAATWFMNEVQRRYGAALMPTRKQRAVKEESEGRPGESLLNSLLLADRKFFVSNKCEKFIWEVMNYVRDEKGQYPRKNDHLVDLLFYWINDSGYELDEAVEGDETRPQKAPLTIEQSMMDWQRGNDLSAGIDPSMFEDMDSEWN